LYLLLGSQQKAARKGQGRRKARNLRTSALMERLFTTLALGMLAVGGRHYYSHMKKKKKDQLNQAKLEVWEGEGGAVPVAPDRTAAQVTPRQPSPRADN
jgi:hypothetical protein